MIADLYAASKVCEEKIRKSQAIQQHRSPTMLSIPAQGSSEYEREWRERKIRIDAQLEKLVSAL